MSTTQTKADLMQQIAEAEEDEAKASGADLGSRRKFNEFECPTCTAYNPHEDFGNEEIVRCSYCGIGFKALVDDEGKLKLKED